jgi:hypothetical protein
MLKTAQRRSKQRRARIVKSETVPAPVAGWDAKNPLASMPPLAAVQLKNWFPQPGWVEVRKGYKWHSWDVGSGVLVVSSVDDATDTFTSNSHGLADDTVVKFRATTTLPGGITASDSYYVISSATNTFQVSQTVGGSAVDLSSAGAGTIYVYELSEPTVETLAVWQGPASNKMFAAGGGAIWDVTLNAAATLAYPADAQNDRWQWCNHTTSAGQFLWMCNGADDPVHYNGSAWAEPTITGITASNIASVISHKKRLWFVLKDSTKGAYLATEAIAGAATEFQFGSLFSRGGYLQALATWTRDGGQGVDDYLVAVSDRGQAAVYQGTDPAEADTWELVGVFDIPRPIGRRCFHRYGADLLLITLEGVFPLSQLLAVDQSQVSRVAITDNIAPEFSDSARLYGSNFGWEIAVYPRGTRLMVNVPTAEGTRAEQYVMNTITGAWCEYDNHNATTWAVYNDAPYFAAADGAIYQADTGSTDIDTPISATGQAAYSAFRMPNIKRFSMIRPLVTASGNNRPSVGISTDFTETSALSTLTGATNAATATWDSAVWDNATWSTEFSEISEWANATAIGTFGSVKFRAQTGASSGGGAWGIGLWGTVLWGSQGRSNETMRIQGFVLLYEPGEYI